MSVIDDERWRAVTTRDRRADGTFYYSVRTTGVYSRPSCVARPARRENVLFFDTAAEAESAGFRPCRRCRPTEPTLNERHTAAVVQACRLVTGRQGRVSLDDLAGAVGFSRFHFHRVFKSVTGLTPHSYMAACRAERVRSELVAAESVTDAIYDSGFNSNGHFYAASPEILGMTPSSFRAGGHGTHIRYHLGPCSTGRVLVALTDRGVCEVLLGADVDGLVWRLRSRFPNARLDAVDPISAERINRILASAEPPLGARELPGEVRGIVLRQRIREALREATPNLPRQHGLHGKKPIVARSRAN
jgi:AraC family transcriptional regulator of adaptative response/methylated-DNA-[protein]-cysteine methyltransferase